MICRPQTVIKKYYNIYPIFTAYYLDKCYKDDPQVNNCLRDSANKLARYLQQGVPELGIEEVRYPPTTNSIIFSYKKIIF